MMKFLNFLTSRRFAIILLCLSLVLLILWIFLSISFCTIKRVVDRVKGRGIGFWGSVVFHSGLLIIIAATFIAPITRFWATVVLPQGMNVNLEDGQFAAIHSTPVLEEIPFISLKLDWQETQYEDGRFPVDHAAGLSIGLMDGDGFRQTDEKIRVNSPIWKDGYQFLLTSGSLSPRFVLRDREGEAVFNRFVNVSNATDQEDTFEIPGTGLTIYTRFFPDMLKKGDNYGTRSRELKNPAFGIKVTTKKDPFRNIWRGVLKKGEKGEFRGMTLEFADLKPVVTLEVMKDPTYYGIFAGWALIVAGLMVRYLPIGILGIVIKKGQHGTLKSPMDTVTNRREI
jgi:cytochrome c biogenesis protein ResB